MNFIPFSGVENSLLNFFKRLNTPCLSIYIVALIYDLYSTLRGAQFRLTLKKHRVSIAGSQPVHLEKIYLLPHKTLQNVALANVVLAHQTEFGHKIQPCISTRINRHITCNY
jgi:hypothetical protein